MSKFISIEEAVSKVKDGMTIMVGVPGQRSRSIDCQQTSKETFRVTHRDEPAHERTNE